MQLEFLTCQVTFIAFILYLALYFLRMAYLTVF